MEEERFSATKNFRGAVSSRGRGLATLLSRSKQVKARVKTLAAKTKGRQTRNRRPDLQDACILNPSVAAWFN